MVGYIVAASAGWPSIKGRTRNDAMLNYLRIRDLALIEEVALELGPGLSVLTGETGAGKSILLGGLALLSGERAALDQMRAEASEAVIEGAFDLTGRPDVDALLEEDSLGADEPTMLVRRTITSAGSRAHVNDRLVTLRVLRGVGEQLVEIASQHESQMLVRPRAQLDLVDRAGGLSDLRERVGELYDTAQEVGAALDELRADDRERAQRADYLRFQVEEIRAAGLSADEETELVAQRQRLRHAEELAAAAGEALELLYESEESASALAGRAGALVERIERLDPSSGLSGATLDEARYALEETARQLQPYRDGVQADPARLDVVEQRLATIDDLRRKYGDSIEEILAKADAAERELAAFENRDQELERLTGEVRRVGRAYDESATELGRARRVAAAALEKAITASLQELGMEGSAFTATLRARDSQPSAVLPPGASRIGYESVEFLLAANPGEPAKPLSRVASGGELSRVMLALKAAEVSRARSQTLVFDEIDAGVGGGRVAERLAERLDDLSSRHQVLVVTHLPQIAARASTHFRVSKGHQDGRSRVRVERLDREQRVEELSRMLGGVEITQSVREHARDLLSRS